MTDHINGYLVTLEKELRDDDAEATLTALRQIKGVLKVRPMVSEPSLYMARDQIRHELSMKLWEALNKEP